MPATAPLAHTADLFNSAPAETPESDPCATRPWIGVGDAIETRQLDGTWTNGHRATCVVHTTAGWRVRVEPIDKADDAQVLPGDEVRRCGCSDNVQSVKSGDFCGWKDADCEAPMTGKLVRVVGEVAVVRLTCQMSDRNGVVLPFGYEQPIAFDRLTLVPPSLDD